jgi:PD-(D/E)XK endonuclease
MKKRNKRKPKIADRKLRGEWAEMVFMARATELGIPVSKPWGESRGYDLVVGRPRRFVAVQVKSTTSTLEPGWICNVRAGHKPYPPGSFDFLAAYVVFEDAWYIIPEEEVRGMENITLHTGSSWAKYEEYREAWYLLDPDTDAEPGHIDDIQGCAEEFSSEPCGAA